MAKPPPLTPRVLLPHQLCTHTRTSWNVGNFTPVPARPCHHPPHWHEHLQPGDFPAGGSAAGGGGRGRRAAAGAILENASVFRNSGNLYLLDGMGALGGAWIIQCQVHARRSRSAFPSSHTGFAMPANPPLFATPLCHAAFTSSTCLEATPTAPADLLLRWRPDPESPVR
jgi:hypothetical protein